MEAGTGAVALVVICCWAVREGSEELRGARGARRSGHCVRMS